jgi:hypothetical protein
MSVLLSLKDVTVHPLGKPSGKLFYIDFKYESISEKRRKKLDELFPEFKNDMATNI